MIFNGSLNKTDFSKFSKYSIADELVPEMEFTKIIIDCRKKISIIETTNKKNDKIKIFFF